MPEDNPLIAASLSRLETLVTERFNTFEVKIDSLRTDDKKASEEIIKLAAHVDAENAKTSSRIDRLERFMWVTLGIAVASGFSNIASFLN
jgi:hypothetical protein